MGRVQLLPPVERRAAWPPPPTSPLADAGAEQRQQRQQEEEDEDGEEDVTRSPMASEQRRQQQDMECVDVGLQAQGLPASIPVCCNDLRGLFLVAKGTVRLPDGREVRCARLPGPLPPACPGWCAGSAMCRRFCSCVG